MWKYNNLNNIKQSASDNNIEELLSPTQSTKTLLLVLKKLGRLPRNFNGQLLLPLLNHKEKKIRVLAVKNLGKLSNINYFDKLSEISSNDLSSEVRRESVSSIGRMRNEITIPFLLNKLSDSDPKGSKQY